MHRGVYLTAAALTLAREIAAIQPRGVEHSTLLLPEDVVDKEYDYIVVGGGTAGLTVADRLSEDNKVSVLVVEYGELSDSQSILTLNGGGAAMNPNLMFSLSSVPQVNMRNKTAPVGLGKVVGGSSAVNGMMAIRGTTEDYDRWGGFFGKSQDSGWSFQGLLPYFQKALNFVPPDDAVTKASDIKFDSKYWGSNRSGVYAAWPTYQYPGIKVQVEAYKEMGATVAPDSGAGQTGVYWYPTFMDPKNVTRSYSRTGHYSNLNRTNYHLVTQGKVNRILLNGTTATGITFVSLKTPQNTNSTAPSNSTNNSMTVMARKEVILAAGAVHSPQILQLSGIGPRKVLDAANITTIIDLPGVGQNFQDHPVLPAGFVFSNFSIHPSQSEIYRNATFRAWATEMWQANKTGPFSIASGNAAAWLAFPLVSPRYAEISANLSSQDHASCLPENTDPTVVAGYKAQMQSYAQALRSNNTAFFNNVLSGGINHGFNHLHPLSRGSININPANPQGEPLVDYGALSNPLDIPIMVDMFRFMRRFYMNNTINAQLGPQELSPGASVTSESDLAAYVSQAMTPTEFHPVGTCAMMPKELGGVVDQRLKVYGVKNLRVVDGSMMPTLPGANTCQTVYAVAEKAADLIKADS